MPTYGPDGSIQLDSTNTVGGSPTQHGGMSGGSGSMGYSDSWFRENLGALDGVAADRDYDHYDPHFRHGWDSASRHRGRTFDQAESDIEREWRTTHADRDWHDYRSAVRHAFDRAMHVFEGQPDPDRRR